MHWHVLFSLFVAAMLLAASLGMLFAGLRGRRVNSHPYCRFCRFDLFGQPAGTRDCPECGADLSARGAVRMGRRHPRAGMILLGMALLPMSAGWLALTWAAHRGADFAGYKPAFWLIHDTASVDPRMRDAALRELTMRAAYGKLSASQISALADRALAFQADETAPWSPLWGEFLEKAQIANVLPSAKWDAYMSGAVRCYLSIRPRISVGDGLPWFLCYRPARVGSIHPFHIEITGEIEDLQETGGSMGSASWHRVVDLADPDGGSGADGFVKKISFDGRTPGHQTSTLSGLMTIYDAPPPAGKLLLTKPLTLTASWTLLRYQESVRLNTDEKWRSAVEKSLHARFIPLDTEYGRIEIDISVDPPPVNLVYGAEVVYAGKTVPSIVSDNRLFVRRGEKGEHSFFFWDAALKNCKPDQIHLVLTPDPHKAAETLDMEEIRGGRIDMSNLRVGHELK